MKNFPLRRPVDYIFLFLKGLCIGASGVLQGVSGGSMALLVGIYQEFVFSLRALDKTAFQLLTRKKFQDFWKKINGNFLMILLAGTITGLATLRGALGYFFRQHFILTSSFFFSLVIIAALLLLRKIKRWNAIVAFCLLLGFFISYFLTRSPIFPLPGNLFFSFIAGIITGATFALPGLSGAFILMFFGKYQYILTSFGSLEIDIMAFFIAGGILGICVIARFIGTLLADYFNLTVALLAGLMMGSLNKIWPWREVYEYTTNLQGKQVPVFDKSILPLQYLELTGKDPKVSYAILMMASGVLMVVIIEKIAARLKTKS